MQGTTISMTHVLIFLSIVRHITAFSSWINFVISIVLEKLRLEIV